MYQKDMFGISTAIQYMKYKMHDLQFHRKSWQIFLMQAEINPVIYLKQDAPNYI